MWHLLRSGQRGAGRGVLPLVLVSPLALLSPDSPAETIDGEPRAPRVATVLGTEIRTGDPEEMRYWILRKLTDRYAADRDIEVTPEEIDAYVEATRRLSEKDRKEREARWREIEEQLASLDLSDAERRALVSERDSPSPLQRNLEEMAKGDAEDPEEARQARRTVAATFIRQWRINQALYREYEGRVIFQQGVYEPLDAYRKFLAAQHGRRAFHILDEDFEHRGLSVRRCLTGKSRSPSAGDCG